MTNQLPEAGGVAWTELYTSDGVKINLTSRALTPAMAWKNLVSAIDEVGALTSRPALNQPPPPRPPVTNQVQPTKQQIDNGVGKNWGLLESKPKVSDLGFGDCFEIKVDEYEANPAEIRFYRSGMQYPEYTHNMLNDYSRGRFNELFKNWMPDEDEKRRPIPGGSIILSIQCTDKNKQTKNGNPYQNLDGMRRP